jgi:hypothetical protein
MANRMCNTPSKHKQQGGITDIVRVEIMIPQTDS